MSVYILIYMDKIFASGLVAIVTTLAVYLSSLTPPELNVAGDRSAQTQKSRI